MKIRGAQKLAQALFEEESLDVVTEWPSIDGYRLIKELGRGGAAVVYQGVVSATGRRVAIKILHLNGSKPAAHILHELDRLAAVRSQVVPHVFEHGWSDGQIFIVTEYIDGVDPIEYVNGASLREKVELLVRIADAVGVLNGRGIIHRDLKPSNILITSEGTPVLIDLGIAMLLDCDLDKALYMTTDTTGTLAYMSPEQARGENHDVTTRWDVYAIGAIAYEILTGSTPFEHSDGFDDILRRVQHESPRSPLSLNRDLPKPLSHILLKACSNKTQERYETAQLFRDDLYRWLNHEPVLAGPQTLFKKTLRTAMRHPVLAIAAICAVMFVATMATTTGYVRWQHFQPNRFVYDGSGWISETSLRSRSDNELHSWKTESKTGIRYPGRIFDTRSGKIAIIGLHEHDIESGHRGLVGYSLGEYGEPAWVARQEVPVSLQSESLSGADTFSFVFMHLDVVDVFPNITGFEIVSVHRHSLYSVCAIQIHSADGKLLSEYYHDGQVHDIYWNPIHEQLVCAAVNSDGDWISRGASTNGVSTYPFVFFAIKPEVGALGQVVRYPGSHIGKDPEWYQCLLPKSAYSLLGVSPSKQVGISIPNLKNFQDAGCIAIQLGGQNSSGNAHVTLLVDEHGQIVSRRATDSWSEIHGGVDPDLYRLGDMPMQSESRVMEP